MTKVLQRFASLDRLNVHVVLTRAVGERSAPHVYYVGKRIDHANPVSSC